VAQDGDGGGDDGEGGLHEAPEDEGEGIVLEEEKKVRLGVVVVVGLRGVRGGAYS
jgi:hypothetical protein